MASLIVTTRRKLIRLMDGREGILLFWRKSPEALVAAAAVFVRPPALISVGNRLGPSDAEGDHLAVSTDCTQRSPTKMETISAESRPARGGEGVSRHPGFMCPITQNDGISMNNAAAPAASCAGLECDVHKRHKKRKGRGCSERSKPSAGFKKKKNENMKSNNYNSKCATGFSKRVLCHSHLPCFVFFFTLFTAERVFALLCFRPGLRRLLRRDVLIPPRVLRECLKQESQFTAE